jgi:hypothetical protein
MEKRMLFIGTFLMLFLGLIYAWSLFAAPLEQAFNWNRSQTSITFSISMITFCLGSIISGIILRKRPPGNIILVSAMLFLTGFFRLPGSPIAGVCTCPMGFYVGWEWGLAITQFYLLFPSGIQIEPALLPELF